MSSSKGGQAVDLAGAVRRTATRLHTSSALLRTATKPSTASNVLPIPPTTLHPSLLAILAQLKSNVTALSLAFSGKAVTPDAAVAQLDKAAQGAEQLVACVVACPAGSRMQAEWAEGVAGLHAALGKLVAALGSGFQMDPPYAPIHSADNAASSSSSAQPAAPYLAATSAVWSRIDALSGSASPSEAAAVRKLWQSEAEALEDAQREFKELLEADEGVGEEEEDADGEDGGEWAELEKELGASAEGNRLSIAERDRVKALDLIVRLVVSLHARTSRFLLPLLPPSAPLDDLLAHGARIASHTDHLVSELYAPQDVAQIRAVARELVVAAERVAAVCSEALRSEEGATADALESGMAALSTVDTPRVESNPAVTKELKWLGLWKTQMDKEKLKWEAAESSAAAHD